MKIKFNRYFSVLSLMLCLSLSLAETISAQQLDSGQIKVAYLFNFIKHIKWPDEDKKANFVVAIYDDRAFYNILKKALNNRNVKNKSIVVIEVKSVREARTADLFYLPSHQNSRLAQYATDIRGSQTLLVTDDSADKHSVMLNLVYNKETLAISFEVNKSNIVFEKLKTSPELLLFGGTELDVATLYRETEVAMQATRDRETALNKKLASQERLLANSSVRLNALNQKLQTSTKELDKHKVEFIKLEENVNKQKIKLADKEQELDSILGELTRAKEQFTSQQEAVQVKAHEYDQMAKRIIENKRILQQQQKNIDEQGTQLKTQTEELADRKTIIDDQKATIFITSTLVIIALSVSILVVLLFIKNKKTTYKLSKALSHLEETQSQLVQSEKMASLGSLIAGVAHEINTPLGIAVTSTSLIHEKTQEMAKKLTEKTLTQKELSSYIDVVEKSSLISSTGLERVIVLLSNFKQVAADQVVEEARMINIADYIDEVVTTLEGEMKRNHVLYHFHGDRDVKIVTIPGALAQVITNLITNSIRHGFSGLDSGNILIDINYHEAAGIKIVYQDDGQGMKPEVLEKIFDPFFTTKRNQGGTGLGMNIVFNIINQKLEGTIEVESTYGNGAVFTLTLPRELSVIDS